MIIRVWLSDDMQDLITQSLKMLTSIILGWTFYFCVTKIFSNFLTFRWRGSYSGICQSDFYDWVFLPVKILWCRNSIGLELTLILLSARTHSHIIRNVETCPASSNPSPPTPLKPELIFVTNIKNYICGEKIVMWRNFGKFFWEILGNFGKCWEIFGMT